MEQAHILVVREGTNEVLYRRHLVGEDALNNVYSLWEDYWVKKLSKMMVLQWTKCGRDFEDRMVAELFLFEDSKITAEEVELI